MAAGISEVGAQGVGYTNEEIREFFDLGYDYPKPMLEGYYDSIPMGDKEGKELKVAEMDPVPAPSELSSMSAGTDMQLGHRVGIVRPRTYGLGFQISYQDEADSRVDDIAWAARGAGERLAYWPEKTLMQLVFDPATATFNGNDGQPFFSASHDYRVSSKSPGVSAATTKTTRTNLYTGTATGSTAAGSDWYLGLINPGQRPSFYLVERQAIRQDFEDHPGEQWKEWIWTRRFGVGYRSYHNWVAIQNTKLYTSFDEVVDDFYGARRQILAHLDAHDQVVNIETPGSKWVAFVPSTADKSTLKYIDLAFVTAAQPSDAANRPALRFGVEVKSVPWLSAA